jgi:hypothetical protein
MPPEAGGVDEQRAEAPHPPVPGDVIDADPALGEQRLNVPVDNPNRRYHRTGSTITAG